MKTKKRKTNLKIITKLIVITLLLMLVSYGLLKVEISEDSHYMIFATILLVCPYIALAFSIARDRKRNGKLILTLIVKYFLYLSVFITIIFGGFSISFAQNNPFGYLVSFILILFGVIVGYSTYDMNPLNSTTKDKSYKNEYRENKGTSVLDGVEATFSFFDALGNALAPLIGFVTALFSLPFIFSDSWERTQRKKKKRY